MKISLKEAQKKGYEVIRFSKYADMKGVGVAALNYQIKIGRLTESRTPKNLVGISFKGIVMDENAENWQPIANSKKNRKQPKRTF